MTYPVPATTFSGVNPPPDRLIGPANTARDVLRLNPQAAYNFGRLAFSIVFSCVADRNDCGSVYSIAGFHTESYSILVSEREHPQLIIASVNLIALSCVVVVCPIRLPAGDFLWPKLVRV